VDIYKLLDLCQAAVEYISGVVFGRCLDSLRHRGEGCAG